MRNMLAIWREHGIDEAMRTAWERGIVLAGLSAGAMCWFEGGVSMSGGQPEVVHGIGLLPGLAVGAPRRRGRAPAGLRAGGRDRGAAARATPPTTAPRSSTTARGWPSASPRAPAPGWCGSRPTAPAGRVGTPSRCGCCRERVGARRRDSRSTSPTASRRCGRCGPDATAGTELPLRGWPALPPLTPKRLRRRRCEGQAPAASADEQVEPSMSNTISDVLTRISAIEQQMQQLQNGSLLDSQLGISGDPPAASGSSSALDVVQRLRRRARPRGHERYERDGLRLEQQSGPTRSAVLILARQQPRLGTAPRRWDRHARPRQSSGATLPASASSHADLGPAAVRLDAVSRNRAESGRRHVVAARRGVRRRRTVASGRGQQRLAQHRLHRLCDLRSE